MFDIVTSAAAQAEANPDLIFGFTMTGFCLAFVFSTIGVGYAVYAKRQMKIIAGVCGVQLMAYPLFVTDTIAIAVIGAVLVLAPFVLHKLGISA